MTEERSNIPPERDARAFTCPFCGVYAKQAWYSPFPGTPRFQRFRLGQCEHCPDFTVWLDEMMLYPDSMVTSPPNHDLHDDIQRDYREAASIVGKSPRAAAALLRLCVQKLCIQLGEKGKSINDNIASLVKKGLPVPIQQALDVLRVTGNNAVHPGNIDLSDDNDLAMQLFALINLIAEDRITQPKTIQDMYDRLPESSKNQIEERDTPSPPSAKRRTRGRSNPASG